MSKEYDQHKKEEALIMIDSAIGNLTMLRSQVTSNDIVIESISVDNRLTSSIAVISGDFNVNIDIDYSTNYTPKTNSQNSPI